MSRGVGGMLPVVSRRRIVPHRVARKKREIRAEREGRGKEEEEEENPASRLLTSRRSRRHERGRPSDRSINALPRCDQGAKELCAYIYIYIKRKATEYKKKGKIKGKRWEGVKGGWREE